MSDVITTELDASKLNDDILRLQSAFIGSGSKGDCSMIFEDESRLFLKQVMRFTPPKNKKQGEDAISRDLMRIFTPVQDDFLSTIGSEHGVSNIDAWLTTATGKPLHLKWDRIDPSGAGMADFHAKARNRRGRTRSLKKEGMTGESWYAPYVISREDMAEYRRKVQERVGRKKAAVAKSFAALGGKVTGWVSRHFGGAKNIFQHRQEPTNPMIVMGSFAPGVLFDERVWRSALRARQSAIRRKIRLVLSGYSSDVKNAIKIEKKARVTPGSMQEAA